MNRTIELSIPTPCSQNWDEMSVNETGRFCGSCNKLVIDFTHYSDQQLIDFFKKSEGNVCGKLRNDQLDKSLHPAQQTTNYSFSTFLISAALTIGLGNNVYATEKNSTPTAMNAVTSGEKKEKRTISTTGGDNTHIVSGKIIDKVTKEELPWVAVQIEGSDIGIDSDVQGHFKLIVPHRFLADTVKLIISCYGYTSTTLNVPTRDFPFHTIVELEKSSINQPVVTVTAAAISRTSRVIMGYTTTTEVTQDKATDENKAIVKKKSMFWQKLKCWFRIKK